MCFILLLTSVVNMVGSLCSINKVYYLPWWVGWLLVVCKLLWLAAVLVSEYHKNSALKHFYHLSVALLEFKYVVLDIPTTFASIASHRVTFLTKHSLLCLSQALSGVDRLIQTDPRRKHIRVKFGFRNCHHYQWIKSFLIGTKILIE